MTNAPATKTDIFNLRDELNGKLVDLHEEFNGKLDGVRTELKSDIKELDGKVDRLAADQARLRGEMFELENRLSDRIEASSSRILRAIEDFAGKTQDVARRTLVFDKMLGDHRTQLDDHERRLRSLEGNGS